MSSPSFERVLVIGSSCSGKSTFARDLAAITALRCVELDDLFWGPGWTPKPTEEFRALVAAASAGERWVAEGNYSDVRGVLWPRAATVVWLNYGFAVVFWRALRRTARRIVGRQALWHGNRESFRRSLLSRESILWWVITTFRKRRRQFEALRASGAYPQLAWVELTRPAQARELLRSLGEAPARSDRPNPTRDEHRRERDQQEQVRGDHHPAPGGVDLRRVR